MLDFFAAVFADQPDSTFLAFDDGFRDFRYSYRDTVHAAERFACELQQRGIAPGSKVLFWSENRPEWVAALWGCLLAGVVSVPLDYRASAEFAERVQRIVDAKLLLAGTEVSPSPGFTCPVMRVRDFAWDRPSAPPNTVSVRRSDVAEILFTSGATAEPKGVLITHGNVLANLVPVEQEIRKYRKYARPFSPIRFLNLLPLSHMFGQVMAAMIPPMLSGTTMFLHKLHPEGIISHVKEHRISVIVCVPKMLESLREYVAAKVPEAAAPEPGKLSAWMRWWRYRRVHRMFGLKFWSFVVGAAPLDPGLEAYWSRLGFVVIQGYGLTETAPIVSLNHPFHTKRGTVGKPIHGVEVKVAADGEILVRGENVTPGYYGESAAPSAFEDGWLHTGDMGTMDSTGNLSILGRKKEMIVTPEGLNIYPEDVERVLNSIPGVEDSAVVGRVIGGSERTHAVLVAAGSLDEIVSAANQRLEDHQKIRSASRWPDSKLPRTEGTGKLKRREIRDWVQQGEQAIRAPAADEVAGQILMRFAAGSKPSGDTKLDDLGLSSLDRVELVVQLESRLGRAVEDDWVKGSRTVSDLEALLKAPAPVAARAESSVSALPRWSRSWLVRSTRAAALTLFLLPLTRAFAWLKVSGRENLRDIEGPVIFASNHQSHMDTPVILAALPMSWRNRTATAMSKEFFDAHFHPERHTFRERFTNSLNYTLAVLFFNGFPLPQRESGARQSMRYAGELVSAGCNILIYPEGRLTEQGEIIPFQAGVALLASRLRIPVIPVRIGGLYKVLHKKARMATPGRVQVAFGTPIHVSGEDFAAAARQIQAAVEQL